MTTDAIRIAHARRWFRQQGYRPITEPGVTLVATPAHPATWDANWAMAAPGAEPAALFAALERHAVPDGWRVVHVDCQTDPAIKAALAMAGFTVANTLVEMLATAVTAPRPTPAIGMRHVGTAEWDAFATLVDADQREGKRTGAHDPAVASGLLDAMRRHRATCDYWLLTEDGAARGYGMTAACPGGLGLIENLFTLPAHRGRGLMSGFVVAAAARLRAAGCDAVFLDAHVHDTPKQLYARLGFAPVALTRTWVRHDR